jgi:site-specific DNA-methyltransferase (adenine-specific)
MLELLNNDCLKVMKEMPDSCIDAVITDPPYMSFNKTLFRKDKTHEYNFPLANETNYQMIADFIKESYRILKPNRAIAIFTQFTSVDFFKQEIDKYFRLKNIIIWVKNNWTAGDTHGAFGRQYEMILYANKGRRIINGKRLTDIWYYDRIAGKKQLHRNQKPLELMKTLIEKCTDENDTVFDGFMGSGTTGVACKQMNRDFIGVELDEHYFNVSKERIENEQRNLGEPDK